MTTQAKQALMWIALALLMLGAGLQRVQLVELQRTVALQEHASDVVERKHFEEQKALASALYDDDDQLIECVTNLARMRREGAQTPPERVEPQPAPTPAPSGSGRLLPPVVARLTANSVPPSEVFVDGRDVGSTPVRAIDLDPGRHVVRFQAAGMREERVSVDLVAGEHKFVAQPLERLQVASVGDGF